MEGQSLKKAGYWAFLVSIFLMVSKIMGFVREILIARRFGASSESDAYFAALTAIIIVVGAMGSGLNTTLVPIFSDIKMHQGREGKNRYFSNVLSVTLLVSFGIVFFIFILAKPYAHLIAKGYTGDLHELVVYLIRLGLPMVIFLGITYVSNAYLQSDEVYGPHALMGIPYNLVFILYLLLVRRPSIVGLMMVTLLASAMQFFIQLPALRSRRVRFRFRPDFKDEHLIRTYQLVLPVVLSSTVYQINLLIDRSLASTLAEGSLSVLTYAMKVNTLVISVFVVAITTVIFPKLSNALQRGNEKEAGKLFGNSLTMVNLVAIPAAVGMMVLAKPIIQVLFERGAFDGEATQATAEALAFYAPGLVGQSLRMALENMYYSRQDTKTPMINGIFSVAINVTFNFILIRFLAHKGLALATSISALSSSIVLYILLRKKIMFNEGSVLSTSLRIILAAAVMGIFANVFFYSIVPVDCSRMMMALGLMGTIVLSMLVYGLMTLFLGVKDTKMLIQAILFKLKGRKS
ncbi:MAG: murein biosynthesis integral membrane protein MurJ [Tissierellia bacterium]|nr:murein biosynthesis integral membrane protein MurJ [Tissierellia bacterium]